MRSWSLIVLASMFTLLSCGQTRNTYIPYATAIQMQPRATDLNRERLNFETKGVLLLGEELHVRFTIQNNSGEVVFIDRIHTIEYEKTVVDGREYEKAGLPQLGLGMLCDDGPVDPFLEIHPDSLSVTPLRVDPAGTLEYLLRYRIEAGGCGYYGVLFGIVVNFHIQSGEIGKVKSEKMYFLDPTKHMIVPYNENTVILESPLVEAGLLHPKTKLDLHRAL